MLFLNDINKQSSDRFRENENEEKKVDKLSKKKPTKKKNIIDNKIKYIYK